MRQIILVFELELRPQRRFLTHDTLDSVTVQPESQRSVVAQFPAVVAGLGQAEAQQYGTELRETLSVCHDTVVESGTGKVQPGFFGAKRIQDRPEVFIFVFTGDGDVLTGQNGDIRTE